MSHQEKAIRLLEAITTQVPSLPSAIGTWGTLLADTVMDLPPTWRIPVYESEALAGVFANRRVVAPLPPLLPVWVQVWAWGWSAPDPSLRQVIERLLLYWWPKFSQSGNDWPTWSLGAQDMALAAGWWKLASQVHGQATFAPRRQLLPASPQLDQFLHDHPQPSVGQGELHTPDGLALALARDPSRVVEGRPEAHWSSSTLAHWPAMAQQVAQARVGVDRRLQPLISRRLIGTALQEGEPDSAYALGWAAWLSSRWPLSVPRQIAGPLPWPVRPLLDTLSDNGALAPAGRLAHVLDHVIQPALLMGRFDLWARSGEPARQSAGPRFFARAVTESMDSSPAQEVPSGEGPRWWRRLVAGRAHLWRQAWAISGATPEDRWAAWLEFGHHRRALAVWATLGAGASTAVVFGKACPWAELPSAVVNGFLADSPTCWVALFNDCLPTLDAQSRWAAWGLWRTARDQPALRPALLRVVLPYLAVLDQQGQSDALAARWWRQVGRWVRHDPSLALATEMETTLTFLNHAPTRSRWRDLQLASVPVTAVSRRARS